MFNIMKWSTKRTVAVSAIVSTSLLALTVFASGEIKQNQLGENNYPSQYSYVKDDSVRDMLNGIAINRLAEDERLAASEKKSIKKPKKVTIKDGKKTIELYTVAQTVGDLIDEGTISINDKVDFMNMNSYDKIKDNMVIDITRVTSDVMSVEEPIAFETVKRENSIIPKGEVKIISEGSEGVLLKNTEVIYHNGKKVDTVVTTAVKTEPVNRIVEYGTGDYALGSKMSNVNYSKVIKCSASAYCACSRCCGKSTGVTASGMKAQYGVVAVDPRVIPLGTKLYIESSDGSYTYGYSVAADTGGAIKGNRVDLFFPSHSDALQFGRRSVNVYIVG